MNISIVIIHDKTDTVNEQQISDLLDNMTYHVDETQNTSSKGEALTKVEKYYTADDVTESHKIRIVQLLPDGKTQPTSFDTIDSQKVQFGESVAEVKMYNEGLVKSTIRESDAALILTDIDEIDFTDLVTKGLTLGNKNTKKQLSEPAYGKMFSRYAIEAIGFLDDTKTLSNAIADYKTKLTNRGMTHNG